MHHEHKHGTVRVSLGSSLENSGEEEEQGSLLVPRVTARRSLDRRKAPAWLRLGHPPQPATH